MPAALILTLDAALDGCSAAVVSGDSVLARRTHPGGRGSAAVLPDLARLAMAEAGVAPPVLHMIAVTVGPGSFTGVRAALALAQGIGLGAGVPVHGVTIGEAIRAGLEPGAAPLWVLVDRGRGGVFLDRDGAVGSLPVSAVPPPPAGVRLAGDAAPAAAASLAAAGHAAPVLDVAAPDPLGIARAARLSPRAPVPLYVDPVEARPGPAMRPAPHAAPHPAA